MAHDSTYDVIVEFWMQRSLIESFNLQNEISFCEIGIFNKKTGLEKSFLMKPQIVQTGYHLNEVVDRYHCGVFIRNVPTGTLGIGIQLLDNCGQPSLMFRKREKRISLDRNSQVTFSFFNYN